MSARNLDGSGTEKVSRGCQIEAQKEQTEFPLVGPQHCSRVSLLDGKTRAQ